ncbi:tetratricopeptide repeat protein [Trinickia soli]|uniref:tetratricopeptide repeat protein n=1 Tax=Trinickia soli TaxID=380675 RepID=UPI003FA37DFE
MANNRPRIAAPTTLAGLTLAVVAALGAIYQGGRLRERIVDDHTPSELNVAYLEAWLRSAPSDPVYLRVLGEQYVALGQIDHAEEIAARLSALAAPVARRNGERLALRCDMQRAFAATPGSADREAGLARAREHLAAMAAESWSADDLRTLAGQALAVGATDIAVRYEMRLVQADPDRRLYWQRRVAQHRLGLGDYRGTAQAYFAAQAMDTDRASARRDFLAAVRALQSGDLLDVALSEGDAHLGALADDRESLEAMLALARAAHRTDLVERYARALMKFVVPSATGDVTSETRGGFVPVSLAASASPKVDEAHGVSVRQQPGRGVWLRLGQAEAERLRAAGGPSRSSPFIAAAFRAAGRVSVVRIATGPDVAASQPAASPESGVHAGTDANDALALTLYQSFLEAGDLANAQRIAAEEVKHAPDAAAWQARLAQVQEWRNEPAAALQSWLAAAKATGDATAWRNVQRLAPMLHDDARYVQALAYASNAAPDDMTLVDGVIAAYERLGRPDDALAFLDARAHGPQAEAIRSRIAMLAQRAGHDDLALATYRSLQQQAPGKIEYALHGANLLYARNDFAGALAMLKRSARYATDADVLFWRTYGQLAQRLQDDEQTHLAYRHLLAGGQASPEDLAAMTFFYDPHPLDAARTAELQYQRTGEIRALRDAIDYYLAAHARERVAALLERLTPEQRAAAERDSGFLAARAEYERQSGKAGDALDDLRRAIARPDSTPDTRAAYLWMLVDQGSEGELRTVLQRWRAASLENESLWGPFAAAELRLNRPVAALGYLRRQAAAQARDPLWLLTYADAQEMAGHPGLAWSMRREVWRALMRETEAARTAKPGPRAGGTALRLPARGDWEASTQLQGRRAMLAQTLTNGDFARRLLDSLTGPSADAPADSSSVSLLGNAKGLSPLPSSSTRGAQYRSQREAVARDVAVAWAVSHERYDVAKRWLARRYALRLAGSQDEQLAIALANDDVRKIDALLDDRTAVLPLANRIDGATRTDRQGQAQALAFAGLDGAPDDDLHQRLVDTSLFWNQSIEASVDNYVEHPLDYVQQTLGGSLKLSDHYMIGMRAYQREQRSADTTQLVGVDPLDRAAEFYARRLTHDMRTEIGFGRRTALDSFYTFRAEATVGTNSPLSFNASVARNAEATELQTLQVGGMKDKAMGGFTWQVTPRWSLSGSIEADRFYSQARTFVGSGAVQQAEIDYKIRTEYPDYTLRFVGAHGQYNASGQSDALLARLLPADAGPATAANFTPNSYTEFGAYIGFGNDLVDRYTHAWRPYLDVGTVHDTVQGWGIDANVGIAGSVFGGDQAALYVRHQRVAQTGSAVTVIGARYRWLY